MPITWIYENSQNFRTLPNFSGRTKCFDRYSLNDRILVAYNNQMIYSLWYTIDFCVNHPQIRSHPELHSSFLNIVGMRSSAGFRSLYRRGASTSLIRRTSTSIGELNGRASKMESRFGHYINIPLRSAMLINRSSLCYRSFEHVLRDIMNTRYSYTRHNDAYTQCDCSNTLILRYQQWWNNRCMSILSCTWLFRSQGYSVQYPTQI